MTESEILALVDARVAAKLAAISRPWQSVPLIAPTSADQLVGLQDATSTNIRFPITQLSALTQQMTQINHSSATPLLMVKNTVYNSRLASGGPKCGFTLPLKASWNAGDWVMVVGLGSAGWTVARGDNDSIAHDGNNAATSVSSSNQFDCAFFYSTDSGQINVAWFTPVSPLSSAKGGTGVDNGTKQITLEGNLTTWGPSSEVPADVTFRMAGDTVVTFSQSGNIAPILAAQSGAQLGDLRLRGASAQLTFSPSGSENMIVVTCQTPSGTGPFTYTIPNLEEDSNFLLGKNQITVTNSWSGPFSSPVSANYSYAKIRDQVFIDFENVYSALNTEEILASTVPLPENCRPSVAKNFLVQAVKEDSVYDVGVLTVDTDGFIYVGYGVGFGNFSGVGNAGFFGTGIRYFI